MRLRLGERQWPRWPRCGSPPSPLRTRVDANVPSVLEPSPSGAQGCPEEEGNLWVLAVRGVLDRDGQSQGLPDPTHTQGKCKVSGHSCPQEGVWGRSGPGDPIYLEEEHAAPPGASLCPPDLCPGRVGWSLPGPPGPSSARPGPSRGGGWGSSSSSASSESDASS